MTESMGFAVFVLVVVAAFFGPMVREVENFITALDGNSRPAQNRAKIRRASMERSIKNVSDTLKTSGKIAGISIGLSCLRRLLLV